MFKNQIVYEIDLESKIVFQEFRGEIASSNIIKTGNLTIGDPKFVEGLNWIIDISKSKQLFSKSSGFMDFFKENSGYFQNVKFAFIIGSQKQSQVVNELVAQFESNNINITTKKVSNKSAAYEWITKD
jgi:hypothetical protein